MPLLPDHNLKTNFLKLRRKQMKRDSFFILSFLAAIFLLIEAGSAQTKENPYIRFDQEWWTFGEINEGDKLTHTFNLENAGNSDLVIYNVSVSCGCTVASISSRVIKPGKTASIKVIFNSKGYTGKITKFIYIESNDPTMPRKVLLIYGNVHPSSPEINISVEPKDWEFSLSPDKPDKKDTGKFIIRNNGLKDLKIKFINNSSSPYEVSILPLEASPSRLRPVPYKTTNTFSPYEASIPPFGYITPVVKSKGKSKNSEGYIHLEIAIPFSNR